MKSPQLYRRPPVRTAEEGGTSPGLGSRGGSKAASGSGGGDAGHDEDGGEGGPAQDSEGGPPPAAPRGGADTAREDVATEGGAEPTRRVQFFGEGCDERELLAGGPGVGSKLAHGDRRRVHERLKSRFFFFLRHYKDEAVPLLRTLEAGAPEVADAKRRLSAAVGSDRCGVAKLISATFSDVDGIVAGRLEQRAHKIADVRGLWAREGPSRLGGEGEGRCRQRDSRGDLPTWLAGRAARRPCVGGEGDRLLRRLQHPRAGIVTRGPV